MKVVPVPCLEDTYAYLVFDEETGDAAAIDPVWPDQVLQAAQLNGAEVKMVLTTHHHWDHAGGNNDMQKLLKEGPIYGGVKDVVEGCSHPVQHGDEFSISPTIRVKCLETPCHTKGHISYFITSTLAGDKPVVFTGDTLFRGGCGRSFEGTPDQMYNSLCKTLASLPPETQVFCGHEDHSISSVPTRMEIDVRGEAHPTNRRLEARAEDGHEPAVKKLKKDNEDVEMGLRQTAEIVMVMVGVAALRGGAQPSPLECQLAAQAYEKLAALVAVSAPQDLVSKNALQSLIQQLTVPPPPPARPAAKTVAIQSPTAPLSAPATPTPASTPSSAPSAPAQAGATPSPSSSPSGSPSPSPAPGLIPASVVSSSEAGPAVTPAPTPKAVATMSKGVISAPKTGASAPSLALDKALEQVQTPSSSLDNVAQSSSPATTNVPGKTRSSIPASDTSAAATSTTPTLRAKSGGRTSPAKQQGIASADAQPTTTVTMKDQRGSQAPKALARQRGSKSVVPEQSVVLDPVEIHRQIALAVQLLLKPYIITTALSKTAGNYMNTPISCGICKVVAHTTNNVLVCDGCEYGFHLQCLQLSSATSIPKGDWYCPKCVTTNAGRPQPPKYGPLRRGPAGQSGPKNSWSMQAGCGSDASKGQTPGKLLLQSRKKELDAAQDSVEPSSPALGACTNSRPEAVARRHSMEEYARDGAQQSDSSAGVPEQEVSDLSLKLEWLGPVVSSGQEKLYYSACSVGGVAIRLQDAAFFRPEAPDVPPYIARLQALWEDKSSGQKWVKVNWCYYPSDLPVNTGRPVIRDPREVYESNHSDNNLVGCIQGPCLVLSPLKYREELDRRSKNPKEDPIPLFLCQWFYDALKGLFRASSDDSS